MGTVAFKLKIRFSYIYTWTFRYAIVAEKMRKKQQKSTKSCSNGKEIYVIIDVTQKKTSHNSVGGIHDDTVYGYAGYPTRIKQKFSAVYHKYRYFLWYLANERLKDGPRGGRGRRYRKRFLP